MGRNTTRSPSPTLSRRGSVAKRPESGALQRAAPACLNAPHPLTPSPQGRRGHALFRFVRFSLKPQRFHVVQRLRAGAVRLVVGSAAPSIVRRVRKSIELKRIHQFHAAWPSGAVLPRSRTCRGADCEACGQVAPQGLVRNVRIQSTAIKIKLAKENHLAGVSRKERRPDAIVQLQTVPINAPLPGGHKQRHCLRKTAVRIWLSTVNFDVEIVLHSLLALRRAFDAEQVGRGRARAHHAHYYQRKPFWRRLSPRKINC